MSAAAIAAAARLAAACPLPSRCHFAPCIHHTPGANPLTASLSIALLGRQPPPALPGSELLPVPDLHMSLLTPASVSLLRRLGVWRSLAPAAAPVADMQVPCGWCE